jgi:Do/DeqQ family serine protease
MVLCLGIGLAGGPGEAVAQARAVPESRAQVQLSFAPIVKRAAPAVVNVYGARRVVRPRNPLFDDPLFERVFGDRGFGVPRERVARSLGSGVIVDGSGLVVTNHHIIEGMTEVKVALADRREFEAEIVLRDPRADLAVLRIRNGREGFPSLALGDSDALEVGDMVLAIGNPFGVGQTVTQGIVSALARTRVGVTDYQFFIQTDAAINPGNSGGALVDLSGRVVGINTAIYSRSGGSVGIGFAVPANMVRVVIESAKAGSGRVRRPWFGAKLQAVTPDIAEGLGLERPSGVLVAGVTEDGPAGRAGVRRGDVITHVDGAAVDDPDSFGYRFAIKPIGGRATVSLRRADRRLDVQVGLAPAPETPPRDPVVLRGASPLAGATVVNMSPAVAEEMSLDPALDGVVVQDLASNAPAAQVGFRKGDVLIEINGGKVLSTRDVERVVRERAGYWRIMINRGGQVLTTVFGG